MSGPLFGCIEAGGTKFVAQQATLSPHRVVFGGGVLALAQEAFA